MKAFVLSSDVARQTVGAAFAAKKVDVNGTSITLGIWVGEEQQEFLWSHTRSY